MTHAKKFLFASCSIVCTLILTGAGCTTTPTDVPPTAPAQNPPVQTQPAPVVAPSPMPSVPAQPAPAASAQSVTIQNFAFNPATLTVKKGTTVTWTNNDPMPHQIKSAAFNSNPLSNGQSFSFTFDQTGTFDYSCAIHPSMQGVIVVE